MVPNDKIHIIHLGQEYHIDNFVFFLVHDIRRNMLSMIALL